MKIKHRAVMQLMLDALIESREALNITHQMLTPQQVMGEKWPHHLRVEKSLDHSNRVIHRAMMTLRECDL